MASSSALVLLLFLFMAACCLAAAGDRKEEEDVVARTCAKATSNFCHIHLKKEYCVSTLRLDTRSARAQEPRDLALLAIDLAHRGAAAADAKAAALLDRNNKAIPTEEAARVLRYCRSDYAAVGRLAAMCRGTVEAYRLRDDGKRDPKWMYYNNECATKLVAAAKKCAHLGLYVQELDEALRREFIDVARRTALAKAMVEVMVGVRDPVDGFDDEFDFIDE